MDLHFSMNYYWLESVVGVVQYGVHYGWLVICAESVVKTSVRVTF